MDTAAVAHSRVPDKGLKANALGFASNVVIGVASTAPAYSLAATLGFIVAVAGVGVHAPAVLLVSFIPILFVSLGYRFMNKADADAGTSFAWVSRAMGPHLGWLAGWGIIAADIIVMAALADIAAIYTFLLFGWDSAANSTFAVTVASVVWIAVMTWICWRGIELSAKLQRYLLTAECAILAIFSVVALVKVYSNNPAGSVHVQASWFNPFDLSFSALVDGMLLGMFIYWGWDSGVAVNEESENPNDGPGRAGVMATLILLGIYLVVSAAAQSYGGTKLLSDNPDDVLRVLGGKVFPSPLDKLLILAVLTSASASTQTTILPTARTSLSMAAHRAIPKRFAHIHPKFLTPDTSTLWMGAISIVWTVILLVGNPSGNVLGDSISGLGFAICFYYGLTGFACAIYYRREIFKSARSFLLAGLIPLLGGLIMTGIFVKAYHDYSQAGFNYSKPFLGIQVPIAIGIGMLLLGIVFMVICLRPYREFFRLKPEPSPAGFLENESVQGPAALTEHGRVE